jgi:hypothetical protein
MDITRLTAPYVGSASGEASGLWQRWAGYAHLRNLTGGNRELEELRAEHGDGRIIENFQYSILEIYDPKTKAETILLRESFWKLALDSRAQGMNRTEVRGNDGLCPADSRALAVRELGIVPREDYSSVPLKRPLHKCRDLDCDVTNGSDPAFSQ